MVPKFTSTAGSTSEQPIPDFSMLIDDSAGPGPGPRTTALNTTIRGKPGAHWFHVWTDGFSGCEHLLFPENRIRLASAGDRPQYVERFEALAAEEKMALRRWTATDADHGRYFDDGTLNLEDQGVSSINFELNRKLYRGETLGTDEQGMVGRLSSALRQLPPATGECLRVTEYACRRSQPWGNTIRVGDWVTCFPCFMSASTRDRYATTTVEGLVTTTPEPEALAFIRIGHLATAVPLLKGIASLTEEAEVLFPRDASFMVRGISIAEPMGNLFPRLRIGVQLEQIRSPPPVLKNLHSGQPVRDYPGPWA